mgnify:CR=1 FL=1
MTQIQKEHLLAREWCALQDAQRLVHVHAALRDSSGRPFGVIPAASPAGRVLEYLHARAEVLEALLS